MHKSERLIPREPEVWDLSPRDIQRMTEVCFAPHSPQKADIGFIFGSTRTDWSAVAETYHQGLVSQFIVNGWCSLHVADATLCVPHAHTTRASLMACGVPSRSIVVQDRSRNTLDDARFGQAILALEYIRVKSMLMVSSALHSGRALLTLRQVFTGIAVSTLVLPSEIDGYIITSDNWHLTEKGRSRVVGEYHRILQYAARGDIAMPLRANR